MGFEALDWKSAARKHWTNAQGNEVYALDNIGGDRYRYDFKMCTSADGWKQFDTEQDAWYFGVWAHLAKRLIFTYCEGDRSIVECPDDEHLKAELRSMEEFYGKPPPAFIAFDTNGQRTDYYDTRPTVGGT